MQVYEAVRAYIDARGIKQVALAKNTGIPQQTLNAMLNGKRTMYAEDLGLICRALEVSADTFINEAD